MCVFIRPYFFFLSLSPSHSPPLEKKNSSVDNRGLLVIYGSTFIHTHTHTLTHPCIRRSALANNTALCTGVGLPGAGAPD